jgi:hypothetical protein
MHLYRALPLVAPETSFGLAARPGYEAEDRLLLSP